MTGLVAGACTSDSTGTPSDAPTTTVPPVDADQELVTSVAVRLATTAVFVDGLARDFPGLKAELRPLRRLHAAHLAAVGGFDDSIPTPAPTTGSPVEVTRELLRSEERLQRELSRAAVDAESGALAKLLASMSAAVAQHAAVLR
jgi:hypothetical protein